MKNKIHEIKVSDLSFGKSYVIDFDASDQYVYTIVDDAGNLHYFEDNQIFILLKDQIGEIVFVFLTQDRKLSMIDVEKFPNKNSMSDFIERVIENQTIKTRKELINYYKFLTV